MHDRSIQFSAELVRLALAGIAVAGFLVAQAPETLRKVVLDTFYLKLLLAGGILAFALSAGFALLHRYFAGGAAFHHLQALKLLELNDRNGAGELAKALDMRTQLFLRCHRFLTLAAALLVAASVLLGATFMLAILS